MGRKCTYLWIREHLLLAFLRCMAIRVRSCRSANVAGQLSEAASIAVSITAVVGIVSAIAIDPKVVKVNEMNPSLDGHFLGHYPVTVGHLGGRNSILEPKDIFIGLISQCIATPHYQTVLSAKNNINLSCDVGSMKLFVPQKYCNMSLSTFYENSSAHFIFKST